MGEIVNLRRARKEKERREREGEAAANRRRFGRTKAEMNLDRDAAERTSRSHESKRLGSDDEGGKS